MDKKIKVIWKVYSLKSQLVIKPSSFKGAIESFKINFRDNENIQKAEKLPAILKICGWSPRIPFSDKHIRGLVYRSDEWDESPSNIAERAIKVLRKYIEPGGTIQMVDEIKRHYWVYRFTGTSFRRNRLDRKFIDFKDEKELLDMFKELTDSLLKGGFKRNKLKSMIDDLLIERLIR